MYKPASNIKSDERLCKRQHHLAPVWLRAGQ